MTGFKLSSDGDVVIQNGDIVMIQGNDLLTQTVECVQQTNKDEWEYDSDEGINFSAFLRKNPEDEEIRDNVLSALLQVDETFTIKSINITRQGRSLYVHFIASNKDNQTVEIETEVDNATNG